MGVEISKLEDQMERIREGTGHGSYKASSLNFGGANNPSGGSNGGTGLVHLDRIGRRRLKANKKTFECQIDDDAKDNVQEEAQKKRTADEEQAFHEKFKYLMKEIRAHEIDNGPCDVSMSDETDEDVDLYPKLNVSVKGQEVPLPNVLSDWNKYENEMTVDEWNFYQGRLDEMGMLEID